MFTEAHDSGVTGADFVKRCKNENKLIMGIGHRIKSLSNPDVRVVLIKEYAQKHFKSTAVLDFALQVRLSFRLPFSPGLFDLPLHVAPCLTLALLCRATGGADHDQEA
jgi:hypothetical protein